MNAKDLRIVYNVILLFAILFILRFSIYIFNPEVIAIKQALTLATLGLGCDLAPLVLFFVLGKFCNTCMRILTNIYLSILTLYYIINFIFISQSSQILSSDLIISTYPNIIQYFFLSPLRNIFFITIVLAFVYLTVSLYKIIYASKYKTVTYCFIILLPCLLIFNFYYQNFKHIKFYQNFFRGEWIARPMYENIRMLINDFSSHADAKKQKNYLAIKPASDIKKTTSLHFDNIIIIAIESLDENYLHSVNQDIPEECTKNIDKIRNTSVHFSNYFTSAQPTVYGLHAILTSRLDYSNDGEEIPSLFDVLKEYDFETFYFNGVSGYYGGEGKRFQNRYRPSFNYFSEHFEKKYGVKSKGWGINSELLFHEVIDLLNNDITKRKFIVISTIDTHPPYGELPPMGDVCMKNTQITNSPFLLSLCALDRKVAFFASKISEIKSPTLLIITADHSATHGENYTKRDNFDPDRIPLIFMSNTETTSFFPTTHNTNFCSQIDLAPTILNFCSITPPESFRGRIITEQNKSYSKISNSIVIIRDEEKSALATTNGLEQ